MSRSALETLKNPCGHPEVRSHIGIQGVSTSPETWDRKQAFQRSEASSRKLTLFAMRIWGTSRGVAEEGPYKSEGCKIVIARALLAQSL